MKTVRDNWANDIITYIFKSYEHTHYTQKHCNKCPFHIELGNTVLSMDVYIKLKFDSIEKLCKYLCVYYY